MLDHVRSPYGPREIDVTGKPEHWPCGTGLDAQADEPPRVHVFAPPLGSPHACPTFGCGGAPALVRSNTHPALALFCPKCRHRAQALMCRAKIDGDAAAVLTRGGNRRPGRTPGGQARLCAAADCTRHVGPARDGSAPSLAPFCKECRKRGRAALESGRVTVAALAAWVATGPRVTRRAA